MYVRQQARQAPGAGGKTVVRRARPEGAALREAPAKEDVGMTRADKLYQRAWSRYTGGAYTGPDAGWEETLHARLQVLRDLVACGFMSVATARVEADGLLNAAGLPEDAPKATASGPKTWAMGEIERRVALHRANPEPIVAPPLAPLQKRPERPNRAWVDEVKALGACGAWEKELFGNRAHAGNDMALAQHGGKDHL